MRGRLSGSFCGRLLVITRTLRWVKARYPYSAANPNHIFQSVIALLAGLNIPFVCAEKEGLGEEPVASYLYQVHLYHWLETNGYGRWSDAVPELVFPRSAGRGPLWWRLCSVIGDGRNDLQKLDRFRYRCEPLLLLLLGADGRSLTANRASA